MTTQITSSDSGTFVDSAGTVGLHQSDAFHGTDLGDDQGIVELYSQDSLAADDEGYAAYSQNPFQQISYIKLGIAPYSAISLNIVAHT